MPAPLSEAQNKRVRKVAQELIAKHEGNVSAAARSANCDQSWLSRIARGKLGASLETASVLCAALGLDVSVVLELSHPLVMTWSDLPGYEEALQAAKASLPNLYDEQIWQQIGRMSMPPHPPRVEPWMLIQLAPWVAAVNARPTPLLPAPQGSVKRLKAARPR